MTEIFGNIINGIFALTGAAIFVCILIRVLRDKFSKTKEAYAVVIDKQCREKTIYGKSRAAYPEKEYIITFLAESKKLHFEVSSFSYDGYNINDKGILKYKGTRLIDFHS